MLALSASDKLELQKIVKKHPNWRVRERAQSVLRLAEGKICQDVVWKRTRHCLKKSETRWHLTKPNKTLPS